MYTYLPAV